MEVIDQSAKLVNCTNNPEKLIELMGRKCYASEHYITETSHIKFIENLLHPKDGGASHNSVFEHVNITIDITTNLAVSHQFIRHRHTKENVAFSQQSTRYCNFSLDKFDNEIKFIKPTKLKNGSLAYEMWLQLCAHAEKVYFAILQDGYKPEDAAEVLPKATATTFGVTTNCAQWRWYLKERLVNKRAMAAHRKLAGLIHDELIKACPTVFAEFAKDKPND